MRRAESQVLSERANLLATEQNVLLNAVDAYATAWQDRSVLELALNNEQRLRRELEATRDRFRVGEVARTDVAQAEASLSQSRADVETAKSDLATAVAVYRQVVGSDPGVLQQPRSVPDLPRTIQQAQDLAAGNPALTSAQYAVAAAREAVRVTYASLLPSVDLSGDLLYANQPSSESPGSGRPRSASRSPSRSTSRAWWRRRCARAGSRSRARATTSRPRSGA